MGRREERLKWEAFWTTVIYVVAAVFFFVVAVFIDFGEDDVPRQASGPEFGEVLAAYFTTEIKNEDLPRMVDRNVRLDRVESDFEGFMTYHITFVNQTAHEVRQERFDRTRPDLIKQRFCTKPELVEHLKKGWKVRFISRDKTGAQFRDVYVDYAKCGKANA